MALNTTANMQNPVSVTSQGSPSSVLSTALLAKSATTAAPSKSWTEVLRAGKRGSQRLNGDLGVRSAHLSKGFLPIATCC